MSGLTCDDYGMHKRAVVLMAVFCCCGPDPRLNFVGGWKGPLLETTTYKNSTPSTRSYDAEFAISAPENSHALKFGWFCAITATAVDDQTIKTDPIICSLGRRETVSGAMADFADDFDSSIGKLINNTLSLTLRGSRIGSNYSDGSPPYQWDLELKISATKR